MPWGRSKPAVDVISVPHKVHKRAKAALAMGDPATWIDQCLFLIGQGVTHHKKGDGMLDEAIQSAEALLAVLVEIKRAEDAEDAL